MQPYKIINDSMLNMLSHIEENSIDCVITDPPYELGFMGKSWDSTGIVFNPKTWEKCFKALKPGGYLLAFGGSRTFHRIACAIEDAGFELRDTILYLYGSGFPKSHDISKAIDKINGEHGRELKFTNWLRTTGIQASQLNKITNSFMGSHYLTNKSHAAIPTAEYWKLIRPNIKCDIPQWVDELVDRVEAKREVVGSKKVMGKDINIYGAYKGGDYDITLPASDLAKKYAGYGTALKPAFEPIIMARKPFKTSVAENVLKNRVGGINIDECRVDFVSEEDKGDPYRFQTNNGSGKHGIFNASKDVTSVVGAKGRFPANIIHDGSEEVVSGFPNGDIGSAARYFYCAKASTKDRDEGLDLGYQVITDGRKKSIDNAFNRGETLRKNTHPTVKPCELMQYLIRLVAPKGATILDPFMGSGSTGKAVMFENRERNADYKFIGIDLEKEYCAIAEMRIDYALNKYEYDFKQELQESKEKGQLNLFDMEENL